MKRIVPWQIAMVLVTVGTYASVLASGGSEVSAAFAAFVAAVAFVAFVAADLAVVVAAAFAAAFAAALAVSFAFASASAALALALAVVVAFVADLELGIPKRWAFTAYGIEAGTVFGMLITGSVVWAAAIAVIGIAALLAVWKFGPVAASTVVISHKDSERRALDRRIAETERELAKLHARRTALDSPPAGAAPALTSDGG